MREVESLVGADQLLPLGDRGVPREAALNLENGARLMCKAYKVEYVKAIVSRISRKCFLRSHKINLKKFNKAQTGLRTVASMGTSFEINTKLQSQRQLHKIIASTFASSAICNKDICISQLQNCIDSL